MSVKPESTACDDYSRGLIDSLPWCVAVIDGDGNIVDANAVAQSTFEAPLEMLTGTALDTYVAPATDPVADASFITSLLTDRDDPPMPCLITRSGMPNRLGDLVVRRVSAAPRPDRWVVTIRTTAGASAREFQIRESVKMEAVKTLAKHVANDFNNALVAINGRIAAALTQIPNHAPGLNDIAGAHREVQRAARVVRRLLTVTEPAPSDRKIVDPARLVNESVDGFRSDVEPRVSVEVQFNHDDWMVNADVEQMTDVIMGLAYNARDAMSAGGTLRISTTRTIAADHDDHMPPDFAGQEFVRIDVIDNGAGIPSEVLPHIFDPFFTTKGEHGTGLGLARVYDVLRQHEGGITVESTPGVGTAFQIFLPRARRPAPQAEQAARVDSPTGTETLVVIDDERSVRRIIKKALEQYGYTVLEAADGAAGLALLADLSPAADLVILDVLMPGLSGWEVLAEIEKAPSPPLVIVQSGYVHGGQEATKAHPFLRKPYELLDLVQMVRKVLDGDFVPNADSSA